MKKLFDLDFIGMAASVLCLIHCLALPWLIALAGTYLGSYVESPNFHNIMLILAIAVGLPVFIVSFMKYKSKLILATGVMGLALTTLGTMQEDSCCPAPSATEATTCDTAACETECESTSISSLAQIEATACDTAECDTACDSKTALVQAKVEITACDTAECETACDSSNASTDTDENQVLDIDKQPLLGGFNTVPVGVALLLLAHFLNFRKKRSCERACCK